MPASDDTADPKDDVRREPPAVYFPACGALCDIFWWARRADPVAKESPADSSEPARDRK